MYSSLDKIDIVSEDPESGLQVFHQTDHRQAAEVEAEGEISVLFALTRVLNARRMDDGGQVKVFYAAFDTPPEAVQAAVAAAGGQLTVVDQAVPWGGERRDPADLADLAFQELAARLATEFGGCVDEAILQRVEQEIRSRAPDKEEDETGYWTWITRLAALGGELLRTRLGGRWVQDPQGMSIFPFAFQGQADGSLYNVGGKAQRFVDSGDHESVAKLLLAAEDGALAGGAGKVMISLKPGDWDLRDEAVCRPILEHSDAVGANVPLVVYGEDLPHTFAIFQKDGDRENRIQEFHDQALERLRAVEVEFHDLDLDDLQLLVVTGDYFACEKLLEPGFMESMHKRIGSDLLAAGVPRKGVMLLTTGLTRPETMTRFMHICAMKYAEDEPGHPISPTPILIQEGRPRGIIKSGGPDERPDPQAPSEEPKKRGFFKRMFGARG